MYIDRKDILINLEGFSGHTFIYNVAGQENMISGKIMKE
jgi:hypothetical protein